MNDKPSYEDLSHAVNAVTAAAWTGTSINAMRRMVREGEVYSFRSRNAILIPKYELLLLSAPVAKAAWKRLVAVSSQIREEFLYVDWPDIELPCRHEELTDEIVDGMLADFRRVVEQKVEQAKSRRIPPPASRPAVDSQDIEWHSCPVCQGTGEIGIRKRRPI